MNRIRTRLERLERLEAARVGAIDVEIVAEARRLGLSDAQLSALAALLAAMSGAELLGAIARPNGEEAVKRSCGWPPV